MFYSFSDCNILTSNQSGLNTHFNLILNIEATEMAPWSQWRGCGAEQDILRGHLAADVTAQLPIKASGAQEVKSATVDQALAQTTNLLALLR